jgi:endonuclease YncB( thermonuclease family)
MFEASNKKHWNKITTSYREIFETKLEEKKGVVQLRMQGIDALETHYSPSPIPPPSGMAGKKHSKAKTPSRGKFRQPIEYGDMATSFLLEQFGVSNVVWGKSGWGAVYVKSIDKMAGKKTTTYKKKNSEPLEGYIVVNDVERKGRPISWVFAGKTKIRDGSKLTTTKLEGILKESANYKLVKEGLVYPYFFFTLEADLRNILMEACRDAEKKQLNIWSKDKTDEGVSMRRFSQLTDDHLFLPYLFRRLIKHQYLEMMNGYWTAVKKKKKYDPKTNSLFLESFYDYTNPYVFMIDEREFKRLDQIVKVSKSKIRMTTHPGNIVFLS